LRFAKEVGIPDDEMEHIRRGALLHDIGKIAIPDSILLKPGPLTEQEWEIMRQHPVFALKFLSGITYLEKAINIPVYHHERWDGTGYAQQLSGEEIPLPARLFTIIDNWDALLSDRPYRAAWSITKTKNFLLEQSGSIFDPNLVPIFLEKVVKV
jgi:HD-GYP domain-containing protein (c-di-GMP phosphodiesterase class II)